VTCLVRSGGVTIGARGLDAAMAVAGEIASGVPGSNLVLVLVEVRKVEGRPTTLVFELVENPCLRVTR